MAVMTIKLKRGTATDFATENPVLAEGEPSWTTDTHVLKIGDGVTAYNSLDQINALSNFEFGEGLSFSYNQTTGKWRLELTNASNNEEVAQ